MLSINDSGRKYRPQDQDVHPVGGILYKTADPLSFSWAVAPGGLLGVIFAGYVLLATQSPYPIIVYFVANYRPQLSHF